MGGERPGFLRGSSRHWGMASLRHSWTASPGGPGGCQVSRVAEGGEGPEPGQEMGLLEKLCALKRPMTWLRLNQVLPGRNALEKTS